MNNSLKYGEATSSYSWSNDPDAVSCETLKRISILTPTFNCLQ